jgi:hypothetical protein
MQAELEHPIKSLKGNISPGYYIRVLHGKQIVQRRPKRDKPPTEAQIKARKAFAEKYAVRKDGV